MYNISIAYIIFNYSLSCSVNFRWVPVNNRTNRSRSDNVSKYLHYFTTLQFFVILYRNIGFIRCFYTCHSIIVSRFSLLLSAWTFLEWILLLPLWFYLIQYQFLVLQVNINANCMSLIFYFHINLLLLSSDRKWKCHWICLCIKCYRRNHKRFNNRGFASKFLSIHSKSNLSS